MFHNNIVQSVIFLLRPISMCQYASQNYEYRDLTTSVTTPYIKSLLVLNHIVFQLYCELFNAHEPLFSLRHCAPREFGPTAAASINNVTFEIKFYREVWSVARRFH